MSEVKRNCMRATECGKEAWSINHEPRNTNRIKGAADQGERARNREALVVKERRRKCGGCVMKECDPYLGTPRLAPKRATVKAGAGVSAEVIVVGGSAGKARPRRRRTERVGVISDMSMQEAKRQMPACAGREAIGQGEAMPDAFSDEAFCPRPATGDTGSALLQAVLTTENLRRAFKRVRANKACQQGSGGCGWTGYQPDVPSSGDCVVAHTRATANRDVPAQSGASGDNS